MERSYVTKLMRRLSVLAVFTSVLLGAAAAQSLLLAAETRAQMPAHSEMLQVAPGGLLAEVPTEFEEHYLGAQEHAALFAEIPCFCGCAEVLAHRHLLDCFVRAGGWEAHALGCGVCLGEAEQMLAALATGQTDLQAIRQAVIDRWGPDAITEF